MANFQHQYPEQAENPPPPQMPGLTMPHGRLAQFRRSQLVHLAAAYGVSVNPDSPKPQLLRQMVTAEEEGILRQAPKLMSRFMRAMRDPDRRLSEFEEAEWAAAVAEHERREAAQIEEKKSPLARMQAEARKRGIDTRDKNAIELKALIQDYDDAQKANAVAKSIPLGA